MRAPLASLVFAVLVAGCGFIDGEHANLGVSNGTTLAVVITVESPSGG